MLKKLLSYIVPVNIHKTNSALSKTLEVTWNNGQMVLDSKNTNYSYGSLQRVLRRGLKEIGFGTIQRMQHILVLGVAGGSVIKTLTKEIGFRRKITGVEIDPNVIDLANTYFNLSEIQNLEIVTDDAFEFVLRTRDKYDLIIIDIFQDTKMPNFLFEEFFSGRLASLLEDNGYILFNTMTLSEIDNQRNKNYIKNIDTTNLSVRTMPRLEEHNELIILHKIG